MHLQVVAQFASSGHFQHIKVDMQLSLSYQLADARELNERLCGLHHFQACVVIQ